MSQLLLDVPDNLSQELSPHLALQPFPGPGLFYTITNAGLHIWAQKENISLRQAMLRCLALGVWPLRFKGNRGLFTAEQQATLLQSHVAVIGCGGLGGGVILLLARAGVGSLTVCDLDCFDESNLNRQWLCREDRLGLNKAQAAKEELALVASHVSVVVYPVAATPANLPGILEGAQLVMDCLDSLSTRREVESAAFAAGLPFLHGALAGLEGFVMLCHKQGVQLGTLYGQQALTQGAEKRNGVPTPTPAVVATLQVVQALNALLGIPQAGGLWHLDLSEPVLEILRL